MLKRSIYLFVNGIAWVRKNRRVSLPVNSVPVKINIGSGFTVAPGWIHVDGSVHALFAGWPETFLRRIYKSSESRQWYSWKMYIEILRGHRFIHHHLKYGLPFADYSADYLYTSHFLEHLSKEDGLRLLRETHRILKPGARIRIAVPDLGKFFLFYKMGRKEEALSYFFTSDGGDSLDRHRYLYDYGLLKKSLEFAGFTKVECCSFQKGSVPDADVLDNRPDETLYVEAVKGSG